MVAYCRGRRAGTYDAEDISASVRTLASSSTRYGTYTRKTDSAISTLGLRGELFEMVVDKFTAWCLHDAAAVRGSVIGLAFAEGHSLGHCCRRRSSVLSLRQIWASYTVLPIRSHGNDCGVTSHFYSPLSAYVGGCNLLATILIF